MPYVRNSFADSSCNTWLVQIAQGRSKAETSQIYSKTLTEKVKAGMIWFYEHLWPKCDVPDDVISGSIAS